MSMKPIPHRPDLLWDYDREDGSHVVATDEGDILGRVGKTRDGFYWAETDTEMTRERRPDQRRAFAKSASAFHSLFDALDWLQECQASMKS